MVVKVRAKTGCGRYEMGYGWELTTMLSQRGLDLLAFLREVVVLVANDLERAHVGERSEEEERHEGPFCPRDGLDGDDDGALGCEWRPLPSEVAAAVVAAASGSQRPNSHHPWSVY